MPSETPLSDLLAYDPGTGIITWKVKRPGSKKIAPGVVAGCLNSDGYVVIRVNGPLYLGHRLAVFLHTGKWPDGKVDHRNGVKNDNKWLNLRVGTQKLNAQNVRTASKNSSTGFLGVYPSGKRFAAQIGIDGKPKFLGRFDTPEEAHQRYLEEKRKQHEGCTI